MLKLPLINSTAKNSMAVPSQSMKPALAKTVLQAVVAAADLMVLAAISVVVAAVVVMTAVAVAVVVVDAATSVVVNTCL
jgi:hypothetical protein